MSRPMIARPLRSSGGRATPPVYRERVMPWTVSGTNRNVDLARLAPVPSKRAAKSVSRPFRSTRERRRVWDRDFRDACKAGIARRR